MALAYGNDELLHAVWTGNPTIVSISGTHARSAQLGAGLYYMIADTNCFFLQGDVTVTATTSSNYLPAGVPVVVSVQDTTASGYIDAITSSATGKLYIMRPV